MKPSLVILTGAGVSAESGLGTFRDKGGIWEKFDWRELATPEGFREHPDRVHEFYNARRRNLLGARPNAAHAALAALETRWTAAGGGFLLVTQNIDDLHEQAGSKRVAHMHGELLKRRCAACGDVRPCREDLSIALACETCGREGALRPHVVWFGEVPLELDAIFTALEGCTHFAAIGTSGTVWPAAGFAEAAKTAGAHTVELSLEPGENGHMFDERRYGPATAIVPEWAAGLAF
ncbi:MAG: NAD-dependent deacylase [Maricaulaceae bacterium]|nr:NAD-dependent deacylase [Maricaulaceae bacterium]